MRGSYDDWKGESPDQEWDRLNHGARWDNGRDVSDRQERCEDCGVPTLYRVAGYPVCKRCQVRQGR